MDKTLYIIIALIVVAGGAYVFFATQDSNDDYTVEEFSTETGDKDDCNYNFTIEIDFDKLRFKDHTTLNTTLREGAAKVFNGKLNLSRQSLRLIPSEITEEDCIQGIKLNRNYLSQFPISLLDIDKLRKIDLSENAITEFPSLREESSIISLKLTDNDISSVSAEDLLKFKNIEHLYFKGNSNLTDLPKEIAQLTKLKNLDLRKTALAKHYGKVQKLQKALPNTKVFYFSKK